MPHIYCSGRIHPTIGTIRAIRQWKLGGQVNRTATILKFHTIK